MKRTLPFRSSGLGLAATLAGAEAPLTGLDVGAAGLGEAALPQAATMAATMFGARPSASSLVTKVRRDIAPATYASANWVVRRSRSVFISDALLLPGHM